MLQEQVIPINFGQGIDTKTDPKLVIPGRLTRLENAVFTNAKRISKRNGYSSLGLLTAPKLVHSYNSELIAADNGSLLSYSPNQGSWINKGNYVSVDLSRQSIDQSHPASGFVDCAVYGNYALYAWSTASNKTKTSSSVYASVVDLSSGATLVGPTLLNTPSTAVGIIQVKCVLLGATLPATPTLAVLYMNADSSISIRRVNFVSPGVVQFMVANTVSTAASGSFFDVVPTATGAVVAYCTATGVSISSLNSAGAVSATVYAADANIAVGGGIHLSVNATSGAFWIYWSSIAAGVGSIKYAIFSSSLIVVLAPTSAVTLPGLYSINFVSLTASATSQTLYYAATTSWDATYTITLTTTGPSGSFSTFANGVIPFSRPQALGSGNYAVFIYRMSSPGSFFSQPTYFLLDLSNAYVVSRFASGAANTQASFGFYNSAAAYAIGFAPSIATYNGKGIYPCGVAIQNFTSDIYETGYGGAYPPYGIAGSFAYVFDFASANSYRAVNAGGLSVLSGGVMQCYDGASVSEFGFHLAPDTLTFSTAAAGAGLAAGTYSYISIFQWTDAQGNLHQSAPSLPVSVTTPAGTSSVTLSISAAYLSQKNGVSVAVYRTKASGTQYYLVSDPVFLVSAAGSNGEVSFVDTLTDSQINSNPPAYTYPGSGVNANGAPPPSMVLASHNNRLWFTDSENPNNVWYTKSYQPSVGLSPSPYMLAQIDPKYGKITALSEMDDKLVLFKQYGIMWLAGDGSNDTGTNSTLSFPQNIPSDVGCSNQKSVVSFPGGLLFQSPNGIYHLGRALDVTYLDLGAAVEAYGLQPITSGQLVPGKSQVRLLSSSGLTLVFDYLFNQWSTFTNHLGTASTAWNGTYVYSRNDGYVFQEVAGTYLDNATPYAVLAQTGWLALSGVQGFQRVRRLGMLGDFANGASSGHGVQVSAAYDFGTTFSTPISYTFGLASASGAFQYRERVPIQKCDAIQILIQEVTTGSSGEYIDLSDLSAEAGIKKGINKLPAAQSVG